MALGRVSCRRMSNSSGADLGWVSRFAGGLRFPALFAVVASVFVVDLFIPDMIPMVDEILLALLTVMLGSLRKRRHDDPADRKR